MVRALLSFIATLTACASVPASDSVTSGLDDNDGDGIWSEDDCDDADPELGGPEVPADGVDNDCDQLVDCNDVDLFAAWMGDLTASEHPNLCDGLCEREIMGSLSLAGLSGPMWSLRCLVSVRGDVLVDDAVVSSLSGLDALVSIGGSLIIRDTSLPSLTGLSSLTFIDGQLQIIDNDSLETLDGLDRLTSIEADLYVSGNPVLRDIGALYGVSSVGGDVVVTDNDSLSEVEVESLSEEIETIHGAIILSGI